MTVAGKKKKKKRFKVMNCVSGKSTHDLQLVVERSGVEPRTQAKRAWLPRETER